jgi:hypothetical protein
MELSYHLLPGTLFLPGLNSCPTKLLLSLICGPAGLTSLCGSELLGLKLGFMGPKLVSFSGP